MPAAVVLALLVVAGVGGVILLSSHSAPNPFALSSAPPAGTPDSILGAWKVAGGSEVGYRAREQFINQPAPTEAVARTDKVSGGMRVSAGSASSYSVTSIQFSADLRSLTSQDKYATYQVYQRDFFVRRIYLQSDVYPNAVFKANPLTVAKSLSPGPATLQLTGNLSVHGVTRPVNTQMRVQTTGSQIEIVGSINVDMRDYGIDPPDISFTRAEPAVVIEYHLFLQHD